MKKKLLSAILAGAMVLPTVVLPTSVGAEEADTVTVTYSPKNWVIRYGGRYANTHEAVVAVNQLGRKKTESSTKATVDDYYNTNTKVVETKEVTTGYTIAYSLDGNGNYNIANVRTDQDKCFAEYKIPAVDAITDVDITLKGVQYATGTQSRVNVYFSTEKQDIPADGLYYYDTVPLMTNKAPVGEDGTQTGNTYSWSFVYDEEESGIYGAETKAEIDTILGKWNTITNNVANPLIPTITSEIFPELTTKGKYNITKDVTAEVTTALANGDEEGTFNLIYRNNVGSTRTEDAQNLLADTTFTVTYDKNKILEDVNSAENADELITKVKVYSNMFGTDVSELNEDVLAEKIPEYVGTTFNWESFEAMLNNLLPVDITTYQSNIGEMNIALWGITYEKITNPNFIGGGFLFAKAENVKDSYTFKPFTVTVDENGNYTYPENGDEITVKFDSATASANVNDHVEAPQGGKITATDIARHAKRVYFISSSHYQHSIDLNIVVSYKDGSEETIAMKPTNRGQSGWDKMPYYVSDFGNTVNRIGNWGWKQSVKGSDSLAEEYRGTVLYPDDDKNAEVGHNIDCASSGGDLIYGFDVDETKIIEKIEFVNPPINEKGDSATLMLAAVIESVMSNDELRAYISELEKEIEKMLSDKEMKEVLSEKADEIMIAKAYKEELKQRNVAVDADFENLNGIIEEAEWYVAKTDSKQIMLDISDKLNIDFMAPVDEEVERGWNGSQFSASIVTEMVKSFGNSLYSDGVRTFPLKKYETALNSSGSPKTTKTETGEVVKISIPEERFEAGVRDGVYFEPRTGVTETFDATGVRAEALYIAWDFDGATQYYNVTVNYADGTSETTKVRIAGQWFTGSPQDIDAYPCLASDVGFSNYNAYSAVEGADGKYTMQMTKAGNYTNGLQLYEVKLDASKVPVNYVVTSTSGYDSVIYGLTEKTMSNDDMLAVIAEAEALLEEDAIGYVSTEEDAKLVKTAAAYARELDERHAVKLEDNQLVLDLEEQAIAQDINYLDLSAQADMDIIVKSGDTEKYASRDDSLLVDYSEYITAKTPSKADYIDTEAGTVYKLFGGWNGKGNDAVKVTPADEGGEGVVIGLNDDMYKHLSFLIDSIDKDLNPQTGATIYADVEYTDGEVETVELTLRRGDSWYTNQQAAYYGKNFGSWNATEGKYVNTAWVTGGNSVPEYVAQYPGRSSEGVAVFGFDIPSQKAVATVKLNAHEKAEYAIIGATATPYTNDELVESCSAFIDLEITETEEVNGENAAVVIKGYNALKELYERHYKDAWLENIEYFAPIYNEALKYDIDPNTLKFVPTISIENGNVTAKVAMVNTTEDAQDYVLIIAAYDANDQLVGVKSTEQATLASMTYAAENSVSMAVPANASKYKALVWESKNSMDPIAVTEK